MRARKAGSAFVVFAISAVVNGVGLATSVLKRPISQPALIIGTSRACRDDVLVDANTPIPKHLTASTDPVEQT